jgi:hypothetical protein
VKKSKVVAGKKLTRLSFEILKIGHREAEIRRDKGASTFCKYQVSILAAIGVYDFW